MEQIVRIVTDSSCDLPLRLVERLKIPVVSLAVRFGSEVYEDTWYVQRRAPGGATVRRDGAGL